MLRDVSLLDLKTHPIRNSFELIYQPETQVGRSFLSSSSSSSFHVLLTIQHQMTPQHYLIAAASHPEKLKWMDLIRKQIAASRSCISISALSFSSFSFSSSLTYVHITLSS